MPHVCRPARSTFLLSTDCFRGAAADDDDGPAVAPLLLMSMMVALNVLISCGVVFGCVRLEGI